MHLAPLILLAFAANPVAVELPTERVGLLWVNHYYDENGKHLLDQVMFADWCEREARYQVRAWRYLKTAQQFPKRYDDGYETTWNEGGMTRRVTAPAMYENWSQYDPELLERKHLPKNLRKGIFNEKKREVKNDPMPPAPPE